MGTSGATRPELLRGTPGLWARSRFRRTRASSIFLVFFAGFGGIASMTAIEVARRDATVIDRFLGYSAMPEISFLGGCPKELVDIAVFALVLGVPLGLIVERWTWRFLLDRIGLDLTPTTSWGAIGIAAIVTTVVANLIAFPPGRRAGRAVVGELLATE